MTSAEFLDERAVLLSADDQPFAVVFEMWGHTVLVQPYQSLRLVVSGPATAELNIGYGRNGVSIFRDQDLEVRVYDHGGNILSIPGW